MNINLGYYGTVVEINLLSTWQHQSTYLFVCGRCENNCSNKPWDTLLHFLNITPAIGLPNWRVRVTERRSSSTYYLTEVTVFFSNVLQYNIEIYALSLSISISCYFLFQLLFQKQTKGRLHTVVKYLVISPLLDTTLNAS